MKQCEGCGQDALNEFAWLIEGDGCYWDGKHADGRGFTRDPNAALRFARREDAETIKHWLLQVHSFALRTTQHGWVNAEHKQ